MGTLYPYGIRDAAQGIEFPGNPSVTKIHLHPTMSILQGY